MSKAGPHMARIAAAVVASLEGVEESTGSARAATSFQRGGVVFARVASSQLEVRLPPDIAEAATRTPDAVAVEGEPGWVRFAPRSNERHVTDRAEAWLRTAWRHAGGGQS